MMEKARIIPKNLGLGFRKQAWHSSVAYSTYFLFGIMRGYPAFLLLQLKSADSIIPITTPAEVSWIASLSIFPNPFGSIAAGFLMDVIGRKYTLQLSMFVFMIGWALIAVSNNMLMLCSGNVVVGVAIGMGACSTVYVAEICEVANRCMLLSFLEIYFSLGILVAYVSTCYLKWNVAALIFMISSAVSYAFLCYIPESPYWLLKKNRVEDAKKSFKQLRNEQEKHIYEAEMDGIVKSLHNEAKRKIILVSILKNIKPLIILVLFHVLLQGSGYTVLLSYLSTIIDDFQIPYDTNTIAIGYSLCSFVASFITPLSVNYWPRRDATIISGVGMAIAMKMLLIYYYFFYKAQYFWLLVPAGLYLFMLSCTIGVLTLSQAMIGELYPTDARGFMCGLTEAIGTVLCGITVKLFPILELYLHKKYIFIVFAMFSWLTVLYGLFLLPETYGKTLAQIQEQYFRKNLRRELRESECEKDKQTEV